MQPKTCASQEVWSDYPFYKLSLFNETENSQRIQFENEMIDLTGKFRNIAKENSFDFNVQAPDFQQFSAIYGLEEAPKLSDNEAETESNPDITVGEEKLEKNVNEYVENEPLYNQPKWELDRREMKRPRKVFQDWPKQKMDFSAEEGREWILDLIESTYELHTLWKWIVEFTEVGVLP